MNRITLRRLTLATLLTAASVVSACSTQQVANGTGDVLGAAGRTTVHAVSGAGRLVGRGVGAGYRAVTD